MARPKLGESDSKRLQMVITEDELRAIEDWQFSNRVPSKSEAIRRLCQIGLRSDADLEEQVDLAKALREASIQYEIELFDLIKKQREAGDRKSAAVLEDVLRQALNLTDCTNKLYVRLVASFNQMVPLIQGSTFQEAITGARDAAAEAQAIFDEINRKERELEENKIIASVVLAMNSEERARYEAIPEEQKDQWWDKTIAAELAKREGDQKDGEK